MGCGENNCCIRLLQKGEMLRPANGGCIVRSQLDLLHFKNGGNFKSKANCTTGPIGAALHKSALHLTTSQQARERPDG